MAFDKNTLESKISTLYVQIFFNALKNLDEQHVVEQLKTTCPWLEHALEEKKDIKTIKFIRFINSIRHAALPGIGLRLGSRLPITAHGALGQVLMSAPTLAEGVDKILHYCTFNRPNIHAFTSSDAQHFRIHCDTDIPVSYSTFQIFLDIVFSMINRAISFYSGTDKNLLYVALKSPKLSYEPSYYSELMHSELRLNQPDNHIAIPLVLAKTKSPLCCPELYTRSCRNVLAEIMYAKNKTSIAGQVEALIQENPGDLWDLQQMADTFNMSVSTFRRKLSQDSTSFNVLLSKVRFDYAKERLIHHDDRIDDIAHHLGYHDSSNFASAFKRWSGSSPSDYRKKERLDI